MSADNFLYIDKKNKVWDCVASCVSKKIKDQKLNCIGQGIDLEEAMRIAEKYEKHLEVLQPETFNQMALRLDLELRLERVKNLQKKIADERERRREFMRYRNERTKKNME